MNRRKAVINIITSTTLRFFVLISGLIARRYLINMLGNEATGLFSLFTSVVGFLSIAELGIGTAITFSMYKPIVNNDYNIVSGLYYLYKKIYRYIMIIILVIGFIITPIIPLFAEGNSGEFNIHLTYLLFLSSTLITYFYAHKTSFINAHMDNYITSIIRSTGVIFESLLQVVIIFKFKSFNLFIISIIISNILQLLATNIIFNKKYSNKINGNKNLPDVIKKEVSNKSKAILLHKIGGNLVVTINSIIIGTFVSITMLGKYSNYIMIANGLASIITLIFTSIASVVGQSYAKNSKEKSFEQFKIAYSFNFAVALIFFLGFWAIINDLVSIIFNSNVLLDKSIIFLITMTYFMSFMRQTMIIYREASGTFYYDRYKPLFEGLINLILSIVLVNYIGISGVLVATIITNLTICMTIEPYVLFKYGFEKNIKKYNIVNYGLTILFAIILLFFDFIPFPSLSVFLNIIVKGFTSVAVSISIILILLLFFKDTRVNIKETLTKRDIKD